MAFIGRIFKVSSRSSIDPVSFQQLFLPLQAHFRKKTPLENLLQAKYVLQRFYSQRPFYKSSIKKTSKSRRRLRHLLLTEDLLELYQILEDLNSGLERYFCVCHYGQNMISHGQLQIRRRNFLQRDGLRNFYQTPLGPLYI